MSTKYGLIPINENSSVFSSHQSSPPQAEAQQQCYSYAEYGASGRHSTHSPERVMRKIVLGSVVTMAVEGGIAVAALMQARNANKILASAGLSVLYSHKKVSRSANLYGWLAAAALQGTYALAAALVSLYARRPELFHS